MIKDVFWFLATARLLPAGPSERAALSPWGWIDSWFPLVIRGCLQWQMEASPYLRQEPPLSMQCREQTCWFIATFPWKRTCSNPSDRVSGKTSQSSLFSLFLRARMLVNRTPGWDAVVVSPGCCYASSFPFRRPERTIIYIYVFTFVWIVCLFLWGRGGI